VKYRLTLLMFVQTINRASEETALSAMSDIHAPAQWGSLVMIVAVLLAQITAAVFKILANMGVLVSQKEMA